MSEREIKRKILKNELLFFIGRSPPNLGLSMVSAALRETFFYLAKFIPHSGAALEDTETRRGFDPVKFATLVPIGKFTG